MIRKFLPLLFFVACTSTEVQAPKVDSRLKVIGEAYSEEYRKAGYNIMCQETLTEEEALPLFRSAVQEGAIYMVLSFWDKEMERPGKPYVARMELHKDEIHIFYKSDESEHLSNDVKKVAL